MMTDGRTNRQTNGKADSYVAKYFDITELLTDGRMDERTNGKADAYVAKSGGQGDVSCKV